MRTQLLAGLAALSLGLGVGGSSFAAEPVKEVFVFEFERLDPRFDALVPKGAQVEKLAEGFDWSEGPVWDRKNEWLLFSDVPRNVVHRWRAKEGVDDYLKPSGYTGATPRGGEPGSNGLTLDSEGRLVLCQHGDRRVARQNADKTLSAVVDKYEGKRFNSPNDLVYKSNGDLYFTDPPYGLLKLNADPAKEIPFNGVYRLSKDGKVTLLTKEMTFPNGLAFSPDEKTLYVAQSDPNAAIWKAFPVKEDGTLGEGKVFFDATARFKAGKKGLPDGLKVDKSGNLWATGPGGVLVFAPNGTHLGTIDTHQNTANCGFGGPDGKTLYITADMFLVRVPVNAVGTGY